MVAKPVVLAMLCGTMVVLAAARVAADDPPFYGTMYLDSGIFTESDPTTFKGGLRYFGQERREMFDRRQNAYVYANAHVFFAEYVDGGRVRFQVNTEFGSRDSAQRAAIGRARALGQLPKAIRRYVKQVWIHQGSDAWGGAEDYLLIHVGQEQVVGWDFLGELYLHEVGHTAFDRFLEHPDWRVAQRKDGTFISGYARDHADVEDVAESFTAWFIARYRADRVPASVVATIKRAIPNRLAFFDRVMANTEGQWCPVVPADCPS